MNAETFKEGKFWIYYGRSVASLGSFLCAFFSFLLRKCLMMPCCLKGKLKLFHPYFFASSESAKLPRSRLKDFSLIFTTGNEQNSNFPPVQSMNQQEFDFSQDQSVNPAMWTHTHEAILCISRKLFCFFMCFSEFDFLLLLSWVLTIQ